MKDAASIAEVQEPARQADGSLDVIVDHGGGAKKTAEHFGPAGDDSPPLPGDFAALVPARGTGRELALGYDDATPKKALPGEKRIYARDASGEVVSSLYMKRDGSIECLNSGGFGFTVTKDGVVTFKGTRIVLEAPDVRAGSAAGRQIALVGDLVAGTVAGAPLAAAIIGPGSSTTKG